MKKCIVAYLLACFLCCACKKDGDTSIPTVPVKPTKYTIDITAGPATARATYCFDAATDSLIWKQDYPNYNNIGFIGYGFRPAYKNYFAGNNLFRFCCKEDNTVFSGANVLRMEKLNPVTGAIQTGNIVSTGFNGLGAYLSIFSMAEKMLVEFTLQVMIVRLLVMIIRVI
jgi:hypothetical protein